MAAAQLCHSMPPLCQASEHRATTPREQAISSASRLQSRRPRLVTALRWSRPSRATISSTAGLSVSAPCTRSSTGRMRLWPCGPQHRDCQPAKDATHEDQPHASILTRRPRSTRDGASAAADPAVRSSVAWLSRCSTTHVAVALQGATFGPRGHLGNGSLPRPPARAVAPPASQERVRECPFPDMPDREPASRRGPCRTPRRILATCSAP